VSGSWPSLAKKLFGKTLLHCCWHDNETACDVYHSEKDGTCYKHTRELVWIYRQGLIMEWLASPKLYGVALGGVFLSVLVLNALGG
jgi:hypothetical protein